MFVIFLALGIVACSSDSGAPEQPDPTPTTPNSEPDPQPAPTEEPILEVSFIPSSPQRLVMLKSVINI